MAVNTVPIVIPDPIANASQTTPPTHPPSEDTPAPTHALAAEPPWSTPAQPCDRDPSPGLDQTTNPDCLALGCVWDWDAVACQCGQRHTVRICERCLFRDDQVCQADDEDHDGSAVTP
jgi:hypothetical protein